jgi:hypothetical protein
MVFKTEVIRCCSNSKSSKPMKVFDIDMITSDIDITFHIG